MTEIWKNDFYSKYSLSFQYTCTGGKRSLDSALETPGSLDKQPSQQKSKCSLVLLEK